MTEQICLMAPYRGLADLVRKHKRDLGFNINITVGNLEDGIEVAKEAQRQGAQAIISRGGTASLIKKYLEIPVVEIKVTGYDILNVLYPLRDKGITVGIVGYQNVVYGCRTISRILNIPIKELCIPNDQQADWQCIKEKVEEMINVHKVGTIIGDTVVASKFKDLEVNFTLITSGIEAVIQAVDEARNVVQVREKEKEKAKTFQAVIDFVHDAVVATDEKGLITVVNPSAEKIFCVKKEEVVGTKVNEIIKNSKIKEVLESGVGQIEQIQKTLTGDIVTNRIPIKVGGKIKGVVATFQEVARIQGIEQKIRQNIYAKGLLTKYTFNDILTKDKKMKRMLQIAKEYAKTDATVLITGESGTGKELLAQSIHAASPRSSGPFVAINCAALPPQLLESELFGYVEGAFTGAVKGGKIGLFELAHNGTIFLDEIGELDKALQARILRVIQEKQVMRLGSDKILPINIRIVAATNAQLKKLVREGKFRPDLFYRVNVLNLKTIPLRERKGDIAYLCYYFMRKYNNKYGKQIEVFDQEVIDFFTNYPWYGNVREMKNIIERIVISSKKDYITLNDIDLLIEEMQSFNYIEESEEEASLLQGTLTEIKSKIIKKVLVEEDYNKSRAAKRLNIDRSTLKRFL